jgi:hypothetical protein
MIKLHSIASCLIISAKFLIRIKHAMQIVHENVDPLRFKLQLIGSATI